MAPISAKELSVLARIFHALARPDSLSLAPSTECLAVGRMRNRKRKLNDLHGS
jgi:hypothetical protein